MIDELCTGEDDRAIVQGFILVPGLSSGVFLLVFDLVAALGALIVVCVVFSVTRLFARAALVWRVNRPGAEPLEVEAENEAFSRVGAR